MVPNPLRGEFAVPIAGVETAFDTTLGTVARIEELCGGRSVLAVVNGVVLGRRAADAAELLSAALRAMGHPQAEAEGAARRATVPEAEAFILALMGALGFTLSPRGGEATANDPLDASRDGGAGAPSRSAA